MLRQQVNVSTVKSYHRAICAYRAVFTEMGWNPSEPEDSVGGEVAVGGFRWPNIRSSLEDMREMDLGE
jgi:hypothetical protein